MTNTLDHLHRLYAQTDDPWNFDNSPYEQAKFIATRRALTRHGYTSALELGCGNGALASHLAPLCANYTGIDAVERAVLAARKKVPEVHFILACYPCRWPNEEYDLVILSEILYFLTPNDIERLARDVAKYAPRAEVICTTYLGDTEQALQGNQALTLFRQATQPHLNFVKVVDTGVYRIDRGVWREAS